MEQTENGLGQVQPGICICGSKCFSNIWYFNMLHAISGYSTHHTECFSQLVQTMIKLPFPASIDAILKDKTT
jgi:hypothetical protein